ncbi:1-aminocyclopropane-1-carboxylate oxidase homolog 1-like isoform X5 [Quercus robur]|uniref:1-aminocyclopropane-1-carboxylate oxidase homolog 1-like isoform X5 n=1 Tax=Quercus robur TaxID=38942 RepID=UPI002161F99D|nr:1-aminocyclopropane-1-carboxylate oxidase homolog 1-like isoform X5 [Quercus robur]
MDLTSSVGNKLVPGDELSYDRAKEVKEFDETKAGVKGLVDSGVTKVPRFLIHPPESLPNPMLSPATTLFHVPEIDLQGFEQSCQRMEIVDQIRKASETWGFFQMINHGVPVSAMDKMFESVQQFHEQPKEEKIKWYSRDLKQPVKYYSNMDLLVSKAASWKDSISFDFKYGPLNLEALPLAFRESVSEYWKHMIELTKALKELLSEALGLSTDYLANIECMKSALFVCHYYPACPESDLTLGTKKHSDPSSITILLQDNIGGLQVLHQDHWVDVPPVHRALVVNIGDLLQIGIQKVRLRMLSFRQIIDSQQKCKDAFMFRQLMLQYTHLMRRKLYKLLQIFLGNSLSSRLLELLLFLRCKEVPDQKQERRNCTSRNYS